MASLQGLQRIKLVPNPKYKRSGPKVRLLMSRSKIGLITEYSHTSTFSKNGASSLPSLDRII
jgi:hypothetical protein